MTKTCLTTKMDCFAKVINGILPFNCFHTQFHEVVAFTKYEQSVNPIQIFFQGFCSDF